MTEKTAEAEEIGTLSISGSDHDDGALNNQADFDAAFEELTSTKVEKPIPERKAKPVEEKVEDTVDEKEVKAEETKPLTVAEKIEAAAKELEPKSSEKPVENEPQGDLLDSLPPQYAWAKAARDNGQIDEWIKSQPKAVQKAATSSDVDDITYVLDLYAKSQQTPTQPTAKEVKSILAEYGNVKFMSPDGKEKTLSDISKEYGNEEILEAFAALNKEMLVKATPKQVEPNRQKEIVELQQSINRMKADMEFWEPISEVHTDGKKIAKSEKFKEWVNTKATDSIKRLYNSPSSDHAILVLDAYKESLVEEAQKPAEEKAGARKKQIDGLHGESLRPKRENKTLSKPKEESEEDFEDGFNAALKK